MAVADAVVEVAFQAGDRVEVLGGAGSLCSAEAYRGMAAWLRLARVITSAVSRLAAHSIRTMPAQGAPGPHGSRRYQECRSQLLPMRKAGVRWPAVRVLMSRLRCSGR